MKRRTFLGSSLLASAAGLSVFPLRSRLHSPPKQHTLTPGSPYHSDWHNQPDRTWVSESLWANRLQDWQIRSGGLECIIRGKNRSVALLTHEISAMPGTFSIKTDFRFLNPKSSADLIGVRLGSKGPIDDYRSAAVYGQGLTVGIQADGKWVIGKNTLVSPLMPSQLSEALSLSITGQSTSAGKNTLVLKISQGSTTLAETKVEEIDNQQIQGGIALLSHADTPQQQELTPSARFESWIVEGERIVGDRQRVYGPIYFAQYTLHTATVKLSALCAPVGNTAGEVVLELRENNVWRSVATSPVDAVSHIAAFRLTDWNATKPVEYRLSYSLRNRNNQPQVYTYEGSIAPAPSLDQPIKLGLFSCNCDHGFPDEDLRKNILHHKIDAALFLGDQFYESTGGFGVEITTFERSVLDYLRKWQQFGWSYRDIFRHVPCISIPDDHDVYHGNVWGESGKAADAEGTTYARQDSGGYKMRADWVRMVQQTQTSHLPDPYDPTPVKQGISVYYTHWNWGPLSFAIVEDRKFKSAPKNIFPAEAGIQNGFITNLSFNADGYLNAPQAELLGPRQEKFLEEWAADWKQNARMKILLSATNFCTLATLPENSTSDEGVPSLSIPKLGEYVSGDAPTRDMDSNGWPRSKRNRAVDILRRGFALHLAGDQHLASVVHYGVEAHEDAGFVFAGPALNNIFPRRWWPKLPPTHQPLPGRPSYTGKFEDGFGNKITVYAAASPRLTGLKPAIIHDRATGYGIIKIDPESRQITLECWKRSADPAKPTAESQYDGWPITIHQQDNYARKPVAFLPTVKVTDYPNAVVQVLNELTRKIEYTLRIQGSEFRPPVFTEGKYTLRVGDPDRALWKELKGLRAGRKSLPLVVKLG